ncbi:expressed unknown protein [Seminavis robusta]|uniref:Uncharacterized protein n=1 Tax=Seminavis robusta TaxID=568900 RepID=A0A9N8E5R3_9STRA|nr:expressed unknown protein [Seminavis robusta]|eukprot:Sro570_g168460.1 n/a (552) ;mRNA; r:7955-9610
MQDSIGVVMIPPKDTKQVRFAQHQTMLLAKVFVAVLCLASVAVLCLVSATSAKQDKFITAHEQPAEKQTVIAKKNKINSKVSKTLMAQQTSMASLLKSFPNNNSINLSLDTPMPALTTPMPPLVNNKEQQDLVSATSSKQDKSTTAHGGGKHQARVKSSSSLRTERKSNETAKRASAGKRSDCSVRCYNMFAKSTGFGSLSNKRTAYGTKAWDKCHCDDLFCEEPLEFKPLSNDRSVGSVLRHCQWSHRAIDTLADMVNRSNICSPDQQDAFVPDKQWERYNFADFFNRRHVWEGEQWCIKPKIPGSLMEAFYTHAMATINTTDEHEYDAKKYDLLTHVVRERVRCLTNKSDCNVKPPHSATQAPLLPEPGTLLIHVRLGDVIDSAADSVQDLLKEQMYYYRLNSTAKGGCCTNPWEHPENPPLKLLWNRYVRPLSYFREQLQSVHQERFASIVLMGAAHKGQDLPEEFRNALGSCIYTHALKVYVQTAWPNHKVTLRLGQPPDNDVIFASQAKYLVASGGVFSRLLRQLRYNFFHETREKKSGEDDEAKL